MHGIGMAIFHYKGLQDKTPSKGFLTARDRREATQLLRQRQLRVLSLTEVSEEEASPHEELLVRPSWERTVARWTVRRSDSERMLTQLSSLLRAGVPILKGLRLTAGLSPYFIQRSLFCVANRLAGGGALHEQLRQEAPYLDSATISLIAVGEANGTLQDMLRYASALMTRRRKVKADLLHALSYPALVVCAACGAGWFMMEKVIPKIMVFLTNRGVPLPTVTQNLIATVKFFNAYGSWLAMGIIGLLMLAFLSRRSETLSELEDRVLLLIPFFGKLQAAASNALWGRTLGVLLHSGINVLQALKLTSDTLPNRFVRKQFDTLADLVRQGHALSFGIRLTALHPLCPLACPMLRIGENTGLLDQNLEHLALFYEDEMERRLKLLGKMIEPALFVVVGGMVAFVYIGFFLGLMALSKRGA